MYHGLGSGITCSAIGIAEEMRSYMKQIRQNEEDDSGRIILIAAPKDSALEENFDKLIQIFSKYQVRPIFVFDAVLISSLVSALAFRSSSRIDGMIDFSLFGN